MQETISWQEKHKEEINILFECIEKKHAITKDAIVSGSRKKELVMARRLFMNVLFEILESKDKDMTQSDISVIISRDRASFVHHRKGHLNDYGRYKSYKKEYDDFKQDFESLCQIKK